MPTGIPFSRPSLEVVVLLAVVGAVVAVVAVLLVLLFVVAVVEFVILIFVFVVLVIIVFRHVSFLLINFCYTGSMSPKPEIYSNIFLFSGFFFLSNRQKRKSKRKNSTMVPVFYSFCTKNRRYHGTIFGIAFFPNRAIIKHVKGNTPSSFPFTDPYTIGRASCRERVWSRV